MPSATSRRLCPQAIFVPADFSAYREASARVFVVLRGYTPVIEPLSLDEAYLDLSGSREARHQPEAVGRRLKTEVREATGGLTSSVGVATSKVVAKIASDLRKPDGLVVVAPGTEAGFLAPLPVRVLPGLGPTGAALTVSAYAPSATSRPSRRRCWRHAWAARAPGSRRWRWATTRARSRSWLAQEHLPRGHLRAGRGRSAVAPPHRPRPRPGCHSERSPAATLGPNGAPEGPLRGL